MAKPCRGCGGPKFGARTHYCSLQCQLMSGRIITESGCWIHSKAPGAEGYGMLYGGGRGTYYTHRVSWELHRGPIPSGHDVHHECGNRACFNPEHLRLVDK